jgi:hypothetical protein
MFDHMKIFITVDLIAAEFRAVADSWHQSTKNVSDYPELVLDDEALAYGQIEMLEGLPPCRLVLESLY